MDPCMQLVTTGDGMCAGWPHRGLGTRKLEEEGDWLFLRVSKVPACPVEKVWQQRGRTLLASGAMLSQC